MRETVDLPSACSPLQVAATARAEPGLSQTPGAPAGSPTWVGRSPGSWDIFCFLPQTHCQGAKLEMEQTALKVMHQHHTQEHLNIAIGRRLVCEGHSFVPQMLIGFSFWVSQHSWPQGYCSESVSRGSYLEYLDVQWEKRARGYLGWFLL